jgi:hypothetical protein
LITSTQRQCEVISSTTTRMPSPASAPTSASLHQQVGRLVLAIAVMVIMVVGVDVLFRRALTA